MRLWRRRRKGVGAVAALAGRRREPAAWCWLSFWLCPPSTMSCGDMIGSDKPASVAPGSFPSTSRRRGMYWVAWRCGGIWCTRSRALWLAGVTAVSCHPARAVADEMCSSQAHAACVSVTPRRVSPPRLRKTVVARPGPPWRGFVMTWCMPVAVDHSAWPWRGYSLLDTILGLVRGACRRGVAGDSP